MKNITAIIALLSTLAMTSCHEDSPETNYPLDETSRGRLIRTNGKGELAHKPARMWIDYLYSKGSLTLEPSFDYDYIDVQITSPDTTITYTLTDTPTHYLGVAPRFTITCTTDGNHTYTATVPAD